MYYVSVLTQYDRIVSVIFDDDVLSLIKIQPYCEHFVSKILSKDARLSEFVDIFLVKMACHLATLDSHSNEIFVERIVKSENDEYKVLYYQLGENYGKFASPIKNIIPVAHSNVSGTLNKYPEVYVDQRYRIPKHFKGNRWADEENREFWLKLLEKEVETKNSEFINQSLYGLIPAGPVHPKPTILSTITDNNFEENFPAVEERVGLPAASLGQMKANIITNKEKMDNAIENILRVYSNRFNAILNFKNHLELQSYFTRRKELAKLIDEFKESRDELTEYFNNVVKPQIFAKIQKPFYAQVEVIKQENYGNEMCWFEYINQTVLAGVYAAAYEYQTLLWSKSVNNHSQRKQDIAWIKQKFGSILEVSEFGYLKPLNIDTKRTISDFKSNVIDIVLRKCNTGLRSRAQKLIRGKLEPLRVVIDQVERPMIVWDGRGNFKYVPDVENAYHAVKSVNAPDFGALELDIEKSLQALAAEIPAHYHEILSDINARFFRYLLEINLILKWNKDHSFRSLVHAMPRIINMQLATLTADVSRLDELAKEDVEIPVVKNISEKVKPYLNNVTKVLALQDEYSKKFEDEQGVLVNLFQRFGEQFQPGITSEILITNIIILKKMHADKFMEAYQKYLIDMFDLLQSVLPMLTRLLNLVSIVESFIQVEDCILSVQTRQLVVFISNNLLDSMQTMYEDRLVSLTGKKDQLDGLKHKIVSLDVLTSNEAWVASILNYRKLYPVQDEDRSDLEWVMSLMQPLNDRLENYLEKINNLTPVLSNNMKEDLQIFASIAIVNALLHFDYWKLHVKEVYQVIHYAGNEIKLPYEVVGLWSLMKEKANAMVNGQLLREIQLHLSTIKNIADSRNETSRLYEAFSYLCGMDVNNLNFADVRTFYNKILERGVIIAGNVVEIDTHLFHNISIQLPMPKSNLVVTPLSNSATNISVSLSITKLMPMFNQVKPAQQYVTPNISPASRSPVTSPSGSLNRTGWTSLYGESRGSFHEDKSNKRKAKPRIVEIASAKP